MKRRGAGGASEGCRAAKAVKERAFCRRVKVWGAGNEERDVRGASAAELGGACGATVLSSRGRRARG